MSLGARLAALAIALALAAGAWWRLVAHFDAQGYARALAECKQAADLARERQLELQRAGEKRYLVEAGQRERVITETLTEVRYVSPHLASCTLGADAVRLLNDAATCASADRPTACGPGVGVPGGAQAAE